MPTPTVIASEKGRIGTESENRLNTERKLLNYMNLTAPTITAPLLFGKCHRQKYIYHFCQELQTKIAIICAVQTGNAGE